MLTHQGMHERETWPLDGWPSITLPVVLKYQGYPRPPGQPSAATVPPPCRPSHLPSPLSRVGIKSATHQPSGYLKNLSVDRLRYRRCFVRELVAFVARLHDPFLVVEYLRGKTKKKWRDVCTIERAKEKERSVILEYNERCSSWFSRLGKIRKRCVMRGFSHNSDKLRDVC